jgi:SH3-like domain-containing protein
LRGGDSEIIGPGMNRGASPLSFVLFLALACGIPAAAPVFAQPASTGTVTGLPVPRFVSLRHDKTNVRGGPAQSHEIKWTFARSGLPVEITAEYENWRRVRDSDGAEGWVHQALLSGRRTALIAPHSKERTLPLHEAPNAASAVLARLQPGVLASVKSCGGGWCRISGASFDGYFLQSELWGVYPNETVE